MHGLNRKDADIYRVEPYAVAADVYTLSGHEGMGGWSQYTGSAGWLYRLLIEQFIGVHIQAKHLVLKPFPRPEWKEYKVQYRYGNTLYKITLTNFDENPDVLSVYPNEWQQSLKQGLTDFNLTVMLDGTICTDNKIKLDDDNKTHNVQAFYRIEKK